MCLASPRNPLYEYRCPTIHWPIRSTLQGSSLDAQDCRQRIDNVLDTREDGRTTNATTSDELAALANRLLEQSGRRKCESSCCGLRREELISVRDRLRSMTGPASDGAQLVNEWFAASTSALLVRINDWETKSEASLIRGANVSSKDWLSTNAASLDNLS